MRHDEPISIRPTWTSPGLKRNARLTFHDGVLTVTDGRRRDHRFSPSDVDGPYRFAYGQWGGDADYALIARSGRAVLLLHMADFKRDDLESFEKATGLHVDRLEERPPTQSGTIALLSPPFVKWGFGAFYVGAAGFGLWSLTDADIFILALTLPALLIMIPLLILAKTSTMGKAEFKEEWAEIKPEVDETLAAADRWLAEHGEPPALRDDRAQAPPAHPRTEVPPDER